MIEPPQDGFIEDFAVYPASTGSMLDTVYDLAERLETLDMLRENLPVREMIERGWIEDAEGVEQWANLMLGVLGPELRPLFRRSETANEALIAAWLSRVSQRASIGSLSQEVSPFRGLTDEFLHSLVQQSEDPRIIPELPGILAEYGVVLVYERSFNGMKLDGAVYLDGFQRPVIGLSFRYPRIDNFWFTLLHELAHVRLHLNELSSPILEDLDQEPEDRIERMANRYASNLIVPRALWRNIGPRNIRQDSDVVEFARELGVHPALVAGMLQRRMNRYDLFRKIVDEVDTRELVFGG